MCDASRHLKDIVCDCGVVFLPQVYAMLLQDGWNKKQCDRIIDKAVKYQLIFKEGEYLVKTPVLSKKSMTAGLKKAFWFYLFQRNNIDFYTFTVKLPSSMMFSTRGREDTKVYHLFYMPKGREGFYVNLIESEFANNARYGINAFIIIDEYAQINKVSFPDYIKVNAYIIIDEDIDDIPLDGINDIGHFFEMYKPKPIRTTQ